MTVTDSQEYDGPFCVDCGNEMVRGEAEEERVSVDPNDTRRVVRVFHVCVPCAKAAQDEDSEVRAW